jgi:sugar/nucleoside kinase (ribokinase family)
MSTLSPVLVGGEALYDFISTDVGSGLGGSISFEKRAGGSPFNIAVGIRRLGVPVSYIGKFGMDEFGDALMVFLSNEFVDVTNVIREQGTKTTLAFVAVDKDAKPEFRFYRDNAADISLRRDELSGVQPTGFAMYHCGGIVLAEEPSASSYARLVDRFYESNVPISLDPTVRRSLIADPERYLSQVPGFSVKVVETTGCGDCFMASTLAQLAGNSIAELAEIDADRLASVMRFANAAAAIVATRVGAAEANPTRAEVEKFLEQFAS